MMSGVRSAMKRTAGIVILDLEVITAGLAKIDRVGEVGLLRPDDLAETVFFFMASRYRQACFDFRVARNPKAVMIVKSFLRALGPPSWTIKRQSVFGCFSAISPLCARASSWVFFCRARQPGR